MIMKQQLHQKQVQKLILAPALQQAIKLLPLTNLELIEVIDTELAENPLLEIREESEERNQEEISGIETEIKNADSVFGEDDKDFQKYFQEYFDNDFRSLSFEKKEAPALENFISIAASLWDHLEWQANLTFFKDEEKKIAQHIIYNINDDGYLTLSPAEIAEELDTAEEDVERIREVIKKFDPVSVGSLNLQEALLAQMEYFEIDDPLTRRVITDYLYLLEKADFVHLAREMGISLAEVKSRIDVLKNLNPSPGRKYSRERTDYVVPDIIVRKEEGELDVIINDEGLPRLRISAFYKKLLTEAAKEKSEALPFLKDRMKKAFWFLRSLDQRNRTIDKVARYIVDKQKDFIEKGIEYIKPLTLMELAEEIGVHESTVGRVVSNKYMLTPRGTFPLKYFFHKSLAGDYGEEISSLRVKERIRKLVEREDRENPLSDIEIETILAKENFRIARRTVAKYRKQLDIEPSHIRKRKYWMEESS